jgi:hypothetical protein
MTGAKLFLPVATVVVTPEFFAPFLLRQAPPIKNILYHGPITAVARKKREKNFFRLVSGRSHSLYVWGNEQNFFVRLSLVVWWFNIVIFCVDFVPNRFLSDSFI